MNQYFEYAKIYKNVFGFKVIPLIGKKPTIAWENWQIIEQNEKDVESLGWTPIVTGIVGICGINDLRNIDFDGVIDPLEGSERKDVVKLFMKRLGLGDKYAWTLKSGSGSGYHIWIKVSES